MLARRLSNAEYDYTIRDLTGQDMQVARQFPVDPANQSGFDNSGESLTMSPALLNKYLQAARQVADHMVLKPDAIEFARRTMIRRDNEGPHFFDRADQTRDIVETQSADAPRGEDAIDTAHAETRDTQQPLAIGGIYVEREILAVL